MDVQTRTGRAAGLGRLLIGPLCFLLSGFVSVFTLVFFRNAISANISVQGQRFYFVHCKKKEKNSVNP